MEFSCPTFRVSGDPSNCAQSHLEINNFEGVVMER